MQQGNPYYQQIAPQGTFVWYDIASHPHHLEPFNVSQEQALRRLHALTKEGSLCCGGRCILYNLARIIRLALAWYSLSICLSSRQYAKALAITGLLITAAKLPHCRFC